MRDARFLRDSRPDALPLRAGGSGSKFALRWRSRSLSAGVLQGSGQESPQKPGCLFAFPPCPAKGSLLWACEFLLDAFGCSLALFGIR
jgi:hypothetical protein